MSTPQNTGILMIQSLNLMWSISKEKENPDVRTIQWYIFISFLRWAEWIPVFQAFNHVSIVQKFVHNENIFACLFLAVHTQQFSCFFLFFLLCSPNIYTSLIHNIMIRNTLSLLNCSLFLWRWQLTASGGRATSCLQSNQGKDMAI